MSVPTALLELPLMPTGPPVVETNPRICTFFDLI